MNHSPGPWKVYANILRPEFPRKIIEVQDANDNAVVPWTGFDGAPQTKKMKRANARLIAAAPDLLAVGMELDRAIGGDGDELLKVVAKWRRVVRRAGGDHS